MIRKFLFWYFRRNPKLMVDIYATIKTEIKRPFVISATQISSKKGKLKKTLLLIETKAGKFTYAIENHKVLIDEHPAFLKEKSNG